MSSYAGRQVDKALGAAIPVFIGGLLTAGLIDVLAGGIITFVATVFGVMWGTYTNRDRLMHEDIPWVLRQGMYMTISVKGEIEKFASSLQDKLLDTLKKVFKAEGKFEKILATVKEDLNKSAQEAAILIKRGPMSSDLAT